MTTYTVASDGTTSPTSPAFPQPIINDVLQPDGSITQTAPSSTSMTQSGATVLIDDPSQQNYQLKSLFIGNALSVSLGGFFSTPSLTGTGNITGTYDPTGTTIAPSFSSTGGTLVDINGVVAVSFFSSGRLVVSSGERLDLEGDFSGDGGSTVTVAAGGELDINGLTASTVSALSTQGILKVTAPNSRFIGATTLAGTVLVQGDAQNGIGSGTLATRTTTGGNGRYVAALDLRSATLTAAIGNLTLGQDASVSFGSGTTALTRLAIAGSSTALVPLDVVSVDGTLQVSGDGSGAANQVTVSQAEFTGAATIDFAVAASDGGASLQRQITVDANTTLRNDAAMQIGGQGTGTTSIGVSGAASGSTFVNGTGAKLTIGTGATLSVAAIQNAGAITVAGNTTFLQPFTNTGTIDITSGTLALEAAVQGSGGTFAVESGATLSLDAASAQAVAIRNGGTLRLSQPSTFTGTIQSPALGARIDLAGITATAATVSNGAIVVTTSTGTLTLAETGLANGAVFGLGSDNAGGTYLTATTAPVHPPVFRYFDNVHGTQFLTTSSTESKTIMSTRPDLVYEGVGLNAIDPTTDTTAAPVYRFFDTKFGTHFYTSSTTERDTVASTRPDLVSEGVGFYEHNTAQSGDVPVYRFFDSHFGTHFYTASATERASVIATRPDLIAEGISFYAPANTTA